MLALVPSRRNALMKLLIIMHLLKIMVKMTGVKMDGIKRMMTNIPFSIVTIKAEKDQSTPPNNSNNSNNSNKSNKTNNPSNLPNINWEEYGENAEKRLLLDLM